MTKELEEAFKKWWDANYLMQDNPYKKDSKAYWAWEGYAAGVKAQREACAKLVDEMQNTTRKGVIKAIRASGQS